MATLQQWLEDLGLGEYTKAFADNAVDLEIIADLDDGDLEKIGVKLGHRKKILKAIAALAESPLTPPPAAPAREAERRQITVMFCDLVGSTALSEQLDPEDLRTLMQAYQKAAGTVIERYGGHVAQYLGDGLMTYFGWPQAHEDDAERAVRAGLEIVDAVKSVEAPEPLRVRFGIATGPVVVGETGAGDASVPKLAVGETPNLAARIQGLAGPDEVIVGASTRRLIGGTFDLDERGEQTLKGIVEPIRVHRVTGVAEAEGRFEATRGAQLTPFVGREAEVALLLEKWEQARDGEGQLVLLSGEPGIGKSRITQVLRERTEQLPHTRLRYQCSPYHANSALYPVIEQLGRAAGFAGDDSIDERLTKLETLRAGSTRPNEGEGLGEGAARKCALFAAMLSLDTGDRYPPLNMSPQKQKDETLQALVDQVANLAEQNPVLMIFEDAHWIDPTSQEMLDLLVPHLAAKRVLLLITYRPEYEPPWSQGLGNLTAVNLNRLGGKQAAAMVTRVTSGKPLPDEVLAQIVAKTDGVPLFVEELTKTVLEAGFLEDQGDRYELTGKLTDFAIPSTIQDSLMARLDRLAPVREVAQIGACIGREFGHQLLALVSPLGNEELQNALQQLVNSELIFYTGASSEPSYTFKHALVQDVAYGSLLKSKRSQLHKDIGEVIEDRFSSVVESQPEILAHHYSEAGIAEKAVTLWLKAGEQRIARAGHQEGIAHLERGPALLKDQPNSAERAEIELAYQMNIGSANNVLRGWSASEVKTAYGRARELVNELADKTQGVNALLGLFYYFIVAGDVDASTGRVPGRGVGVVGASGSCG